MNVSRQAVTKWENDIGMPDIANLQELSKLFGITVDYLLNDEALPALMMRKALDRNHYKNKIGSYYQILKEFYPKPWEVYSLMREKNKQKTDWIIDFIITMIHGNIIAWGILDNIDAIRDLSPYYLVKKDHVKLLVHIKDWVLEVVELPIDINEKKFTYQQNRFHRCGILHFK